MKIEDNKALHEKIIELIRSVEIENNTISTYNLYNLRNDILDMILTEININYTYNG